MWLNSNNAKPDNKWNPENKFVFRLRNCFLFPLLDGAIFLIGVFQIFLPPAQHLADFIEFQGYLAILFMGKAFGLPGDVDQKFKGIEQKNAFANFSGFAFF